MLVSDLDVTTGAPHSFTIADEQIAFTCNVAAFAFYVDAGPAYSANTLDLVYKLLTVWGFEPLSYEEGADVDILDDGTIRSWLTPSDPNRYDNEESV